MVVSYRHPAPLTQVVLQEAESYGFSFSRLKLVPVRVCMCVNAHTGGSVQLQVKAFLCHHYTLSGIFK